MNTCSKCGHSTAAGETFCAECGTPLNGCRECGAPIAVGTSFCSECGTAVNGCRKCGQPIADGIKFCSECGTYVLATEQEPNVQAPEPSIQIDSTVSLVANESTAQPTSDMLDRPRSDIHFAAVEDKNPIIKWLLVISIFFIAIFFATVFFVGKTWKTDSQSNTSATVPASNASTASQVSTVAGVQEPSVVTGDIISEWTHPQHTETSGLDTDGNPIPKEVFDQVLVFAEVRLYNQSGPQLSLLNILTNATLPDGIYSSTAASQTDYDKVFLAWPDIPVPHGEGLPINLVLDPRQIIDGTFVSSFRLTKQQWDAHSNLSFSFNFRDHPTLVLTPHDAIIEQ